MNIDEIVMDKLSEAVFAELDFDAKAMAKKLQPKMQKKIEVSIIEAIDNGWLEEIITDSDVLYEALKTNLNDIIKEAFKKRV